MAALSVESVGEGKKTWNPLLRSVKRSAKQRIARYPPGDEDIVNAGVFGGGERALHQVLNHGMLEARDKVNRRLRTMAAKVVKGRALHGLAPGATLLGLARKFCSAHAVEHGGLKSGKTEIQRIPFHLDVAKIHRVGISEAGELINHRPAGISQGKQPGDLVKSFARGVVARVAKRGCK